MAKKSRSERRVNTLYNSYIKMEIGICMQRLIQSEFAGVVFFKAAGLIASRCLQYVWSDVDHQLECFVLTRHSGTHIFAVPH